MQNDCTNQLSSHKRQLLRDETTQDSLLNELQTIVHTGWPDTINELPTDIRPYWSFRDELAMESGVLFKRRQILIPQSMQKEILQHLHQGHQGVDKTRRLARDTVYWVNINRDIEVICKSCHACQENQVSTQRNLLCRTLPDTTLAVHRVRSVRDQWQAVPPDSGSVYEIPTGRLHGQSYQQSCGNREDEVVLCYVWEAGRYNDRWRPTVHRKTIQRIHE